MSQMTREEVIQATSASLKLPKEDVEQLLTVAGQECTKALMVEHHNLVSFHEGVGFFVAGLSFDVWYTIWGIGKEDLAEDEQVADFAQRLVKKFSEELGFYRHETVGEFAYQLDLMLDTIAHDILRYNVVL